MPGKASEHSTSPSQARLMAAAPHTKGGYGGVPQKVGKEFNQADKGGKLLSKAMHKPDKAGRGRSSWNFWATPYSGKDRRRRK